MTSKEKTRQHFLEAIQKTSNLNSGAYTKTIASNVFNSDGTDVESTIDTEQSDDDPEEAVSDEESQTVASSVQSEPKSNIMNIDNYISPKSSTEEV